MEYSTSPDPSQVAFVTGASLTGVFHGRKELKQHYRRAAESARSNGRRRTTRAAMDAVGKQSDGNDCGAVDLPLGPSAVMGDFFDNDVETGDETELAGEGDDSWYSVVQEIGQEDTGDSFVPEKSSRLCAGEKPLDLMALDGAGRQLLTRSSYDNVVDVDIEDGGLLEDDEDNNEFHCGVEIDALIESDALVQNLRNDFGIETATHVQLAAIPRVLDKRDLVIQSHTGTGKTLAFLLPILDEIDPEDDVTQSIIVAPTRELAMQISRECDRLVAGTEIRNLALIGGANPARQVEKLRRRMPHIVVGTPGRVAELQEQRELRVRAVRWLVIDEVDQCMRDAFKEHVIHLVSTVPRAQKVLVSATGDVDSVRQFARSYLHRPVLLRVGGAQRLPKGIDHFFCVVPARKKIELVKKLMNTAPLPNRAIAFVDDPRRVDIVVNQLYRMGFSAGALRGNAHKLERAEVLTAFRKGRVQLLVTTEVAARGLDVREITHVFNIDLPTDGDHYLHRAGRCARAGGDGVVVSIVSAETAFVVGRLAKELSIDVRRMEPRKGVYGEPIDRSAKRERRSDTPTGGVAESARKLPNHGHASKGLQTVRARQEGSLDDSLASLRAALEQGDAGLIENSFLRMADTEAGSGGLGASATEIKKKPKKKGKLKAKAKAKATAKAKQERDKAKKQRAEKRSQDEERDDQDSSPSYQHARRERRKVQSNVQLRAASEGWVGNRGEGKVAA